MAQYIEGKKDKVKRRVCRIRRDADGFLEHTGAKGQKFAAVLLELVPGNWQRQVVNLDRVKTTKADVPNGALLKLLRT